MKIQLIFDATKPDRIDPDTIEYKFADGPCPRQGERLQLTYKGVDYTFRVGDVTWVCSTKKTKSVRVSLTLLEGQ